MLGFVLRRLRGRLPLAASVLLTALITTAVLTALVAFNRTVGQAGLRQALQGSSHSRTTVLISGDHEFGARPKDDEAVAQFADGLFGRLPHTVQSVARSHSYGLPADPKKPGKSADLTILASLDHSRVRLAAGAWPQTVGGAAGAPGAPVEVAVPQSTLGRLGLTATSLPAELRLDDRYGGAPVTVRITGVYRPADRAADYWRLDPLGGHGVQVMGFTTYGPMLVDDTAFTTGRLPQGGRSWLVDTDFATVTADQADALRAQDTAEEHAFQGSTGLQVRSEIAGALGDLKSGALVARSALLIGALQLAVLAAAALLLVVHLMTDRQAGENALLTARGAARRRLGAFTATEAVLLALPAAVLAPLLTPLLIRLLGSLGPLAQVPLDTSLPAVAWPVAAACALACVILTVVPPLLRNAGTATLRRACLRQALVAGAARSGADLALLVLAVLAYQQLAHYGGGGLSADASGELGVDPVLIAAPTLALCAGTVLLLRVLPYAARLGGLLAARGRGLTGALVGWQLARRPGRASGPVLLLVLAVATGVLALGQRSAWTASQHDQADFATAGGLRISGSSVAPMGQGGLFGALPGGDRLIPVTKAPEVLPGGTTGQVMALDAAAAADHLSIRGDLIGGRTARELFGPLARPVAGKAGIPLPGHPVRLDAEVGVHTTMHSVLTFPGGPVPLPGPAPAPSLAFLLRDRYGVNYRVLAPPPADEGVGKVSVDLGSLTDAPLGSAAFPLTLTGVVVAAGGDNGETIGGELTLGRITVSDTPDGAGTPANPPTGLTWQGTAQAGRGGSTEAVDVDPAPADQQRLLKVRYQADAMISASVSSTITPTANEDTVVPALATRSYLAAIGASIGDTVKLPLGNGLLKARITAAVDALPVAGTTALVVDYATVGRLLTAAGQDGPTPGEWWLPADSPTDPVPGKAADALRASAASQSLQLRDETATALLDDPLSAAPQSALAALTAVAGLLAAIGFAAASAAARAERAAEFAVLLALGAPRRQLTRTVALEQSLLVGLGSAVGLGLGALLVHLVIPLVMLTSAAQRPVPEAVITLPLGQALALTAATATVPLLSAFFGGRRSRDLVARLRYVEEM